jgi:hypothetical protein
LASLLRTKLALFTLNMQAKHHPPSSKVQGIIAEMEELVMADIEAVQVKVTKLLADNQVPQSLAHDVIQATACHPLGQCITL